MNSCLFCSKDGPFTTQEHVVPESLGNDDLVLEGEVCDACQRYFGSKVEKFVLDQTPFAFWRAYLGIRTKKGHLPQVNLSQPSREKGVLQSTHLRHDNGLGFTSHEDGSVSVDIDNDEIIREILRGDRNKFTFVLTPRILHLLGRFLLKVGLEFLATKDSRAARTACYDDARKHARYGSGERLWPLFWFTRGDIQALRVLEKDDTGWLEHVTLYEYGLHEVEEYTIFHFSIGTDHFLISLTDQYPDRRIVKIFPNDKIKLIWYPDVG